MLWFGMLQLLGMLWLIQLLNIHKKKSWEEEVLNDNYSQSTKNNQGMSQKEESLHYNQPQTRGAIDFTET